MQFGPVLRLKGIAAPAFLSVLASSTSAHADSPSTTDIGRIEITGSRVLGIGDETSLPIQVIRREDIDRTGVTSVEALLQQISAASGSTLEVQSIGTFGRPGYSGASLRGLTSRSTLVLVDGRRLSNYALSETSSTGVDLHAIPLEAVDRVEILKDGASAIYGSDAIAGVINFILKKEFHGGVASVQYGAAEHGGASQTRATATLGLGDLAADRFNVFASFDYQRRTALSATARSYTQTGHRPDLGVEVLDTDSFPANIYTARGIVNPASPACTSQTVNIRRACFFDAVKYADLLPAVEQSNAFARGVYRLDDRHALYGDVLYARTRLRTRIYPSAVAGDAIPSGEPVTFPRTSPYFPTGLGLQGDIQDLGYVAVPLGPRVRQSTAEQWRVIVGTRGDALGWTYDAGLIFNESRALYRYVSGYVDANAAVAALESGLVNPFGDSGPDGDALLRAAERRGDVRHSTALSRGFDAHATRDLFDLPAGPVSFAMGIEGRRDTLSDVVEPFVADLACCNYLQGKAGSRNTQAAYAEVSLPIVRTFDAVVAGRYDHYSDFGGTFNPKVSLRWQPNPVLLARASYGRGFRAPGLPDLYTAKSDERGFARDPVRCPVTGADADCFANVTVRSGGNPELRPERSEQASAGLVIQPLPNVTGSIDFWRIRVVRTIVPLAQSVLLGNDAFYEGSRIVRGPSDPATPGLPGPILLLDESSTNIGYTATHGFDVALGWRSGSSAFGRLTTALNGTYVQSLQRRFGSTLTIDGRSNYQAGQAVPRWQHFLTLGWELGAWTTTLTQSYKAGYKDAMADPSGNARHVGATEYWSAQVAYVGMKNVTVTGGVDNLFDRTPQVSNQTDYFQAGYNPTISDPRGRFWYARLAIRFP